MQQYSLIITLVLAVLWLGEPMTILRLIGIALVVAGPALTLKPEPKRSGEVMPETPGEAVFTPLYAEGYFYALLSAIGFGISPILINMAFAHKGIAVGVAGGFISYLAATAAIGLTLLLPDRWRDFRAIDRTSARWFVLSGVLTGLSQMTRYMALAVAPVSVVSPIQRLSMVFRIYFGWIINPKHEVFGGRIAAATVMSLVGAVALSVSVEDARHLVPLPDAVAWLVDWRWPR